MNFGAFIKELGVLVLSPQWTDYGNMISDFPSAGHNFGLKDMQDVVIIARTMKYVISNDNKYVMFGSKYRSESIDFDKVFVWKNKVLLNVKDRDQLIKFMGTEKFLPAF